MAPCSLRHAVTVLPLLLLTGCGFDEVHTGPVRHDQLSLDLGSVDHANVELDIGAGELKLNSGTDKLLSGDFEYNVDSYKPIVEHSKNGSHGVITIKEPSRNGFNHGRTRNVWNLSLNNKVLLDLSVNCGAGQAELALGGVALRSLNVHMGAGQVDLDLRGHPNRDYEIDISGGVGQATIHLPQDVGIYAEAHGGLGSIDVTGLEKTGDHWENRLYDKSKVNVRLKVEGGVGQIQIIG